jgi:hypothetical protein
VIKGDFRGFDSLVKKLDLCNKIGRALVVKSDYKEGVKIAYKLRFGRRLEESFKLLKKEVSIVKFCLCEALLDFRRDSQGNQVGCFFVLCF